MENQKAIKVYTAKDRLEAEMLIDVLKENDIPAYRQGIGSAGIMDIYGGNSTFGEDIFVNEKNVDKALELIKGVVQEIDK